MLSLLRRRQVSMQSHRLPPQRGSYASGLVTRHMAAAAASVVDIAKPVGQSESMIDPVHSTICLDPARLGISAQLVTPLEGTSRPMRARRCPLVGVSDIMGY